MNPYDTVVSLGSDCQVAYRLQETIPHLRKSGPFDWLISPFAGVVRAIDRDFDGFMAPDQLMRYDGKDGGHVVFDKNYGVVSMHDFTNSTPLTNAEVQEKYAHVVQNFRGVLRSDRKVLFIRKDVRRRQAEELHGLLTARFPGLAWSLLALTSTQEDPWGIPRVTNSFLKPHTHWHGHEDSWAKLLAPFHTQSEGARHGRRSAGRPRP